ncbi:hypothetical protein D3C73_231760 [compost metagenome]
MLKTGNSESPSEPWLKKAPHEAGSQVMKNRQYTHNKGSHAQSTFPKPDDISALGKAGLATHLALWIEDYQFSSVTRLVRLPSKLVVRSQTLPVTLGLAAAS